MLKIESQLQWESDILKAYLLARNDGKQILLVSFNPACEKCQKLEDTTFADPLVLEVIRQYLVPVRVMETDRPLISEFDLHWIPTFILLDENGIEYHRAQGYLPPGELVPSLLLGLAKIHFYHTDFNNAAPFLEKVTTQFSGSASMPEALYFRGLCNFRKTGDSWHLQAAFRLLNSLYPDSTWTRRAQLFMNSGKNGELKSLDM